MAFSQGCGNAMAMRAVLLLCLTALLLQIAESRVIYVGQESGWTLGVNFKAGIKAKVGDTLLFSYNSNLHNVWEVSEDGYNRCVVTPRSRLYKSLAAVSLRSKGTYYFICSIRGHCGAGMKVAVFVS